MDTEPPKVVEWPKYGPNGGKIGRPFVSPEEKAKRGTWRRDRLGKPKASEAGTTMVPPTSERDYPAIAAEYAEGVRTGRVTTGKWVRLACGRQERDLARWAEAGPYIWSDEAAAAACAFVERCPHVEGKWATPTIRLEPSQIFLICCLFGWRHRDDPARRRFTTLYYELGRKGAKSTLMAGVGLFHLLEEQEPGAFVVCGATTGAQARIVFGIMAKMIKASPWLRSRGLATYANAITSVDGSIKPINARASTQDGLNPSCIILDESHAQDFELHDVLKSAQGGRANPLLLAPTTAGYDLLSVGYALRQTVQKVLEGVFEAEHFLGLVYTLDEGDDWRDPAVWVKANPMLGVTPKMAFLQQYCQDARQTPGMEGEFRVKVCSEWMQSSSAWLSVTQWQACADPTLRREQFAGQRCWMGCDLAQLDDLTAVSYVFESGANLVVFVQFYLPASVVEARARAVPEYRVWADTGILTLTEGTMTDYSVIERDIRAACKKYQVPSVIFDQYCSPLIVSRLNADGVPAAIQAKNAPAFTPVADDLEARVKYGRLRHDGNSCLTWMAGNCVVDRRVDGSILPKKEGPESLNKIDGIDAILLALIPKLKQPPAAAPFLVVLSAR